MKRVLFITLILTLMLLFSFDIYSMEGSYSSDEDEGFKSCNEHSSEIVSSDGEVHKNRVDIVKGFLYHRNEGM